MGLQAVGGASARWVGRTLGAALRVVLAAGLATGGAVLVSPIKASAAGSISLAKQGPDTALVGGQIEYRLVAGNKDPGGVHLYNLTFRDELPEGVSYVAGSTSPAGFGEPAVIEVTDPDTSKKHQVLIWSDVSDLMHRTERTLVFKVASDPELHPMGSVISNTATAFGSSDPREVPSFDAGGTPVGSGSVVSASAGDQTTITAIGITKSEPSPENELLRGVNDNQTVYTLTVTNNDQDATANLLVTDYLPAAMEFLGCGPGPFNSATPEYPGAANQVNAVDGCVEPASVSTVENPIGKPAGVYTRVTWELDDLDAGQSHVIKYAAGIPARANTMTWVGTVPSPASGRQAANLANNSGASTRELAVERSLTNHVEVAGDFQGAPVLARDTETVTVEDLLIRKSVSPQTFAQGALATYTLTVQTSEYVDASSLLITDNLPAGLCPVNTASTISECNNVPGAPPGNAALTGVTQNPDGSFALTITPTNTSLDADGSLQITYQALMRAYFDTMAISPTSALDAFTNSVRLAGITSPAVPGPDTGTQEVADTSTATIKAGVPVLTKLRMKNAAPMTCSADPEDYARTFVDEKPFADGDRVCFLLKAEFPAGADTRNATLTDYLPANLTLTKQEVLSGSPAVNGSTASEREVSWALGSGTPRVVPKGSVFQAVVTAEVIRPAPPSDPAKAKDFDNLAKLRFESSGGLAEAVRDSATFPVSPAPVIGVQKGVEKVNGTQVSGGGDAGGIDGVTVRAGDQVLFRVDLTNLTSADEANGRTISSPETWDVLPTGISCADITQISNSGTCFDVGQVGRPNLAQNQTASVIRWALGQTDLAPGDQLKLSYQMEIPALVSVSTRFDNTAGVISFTAATNLNTPATHHPADNLSADVTESQQDAPAAADPSHVVVPDAAVVKVNATAITESGNASSQAVVGETITFTVSVTVPAKTTLFNARLVDPMPTGVTFVGPPTAAYSADGSAPASDPLPGGVSLAQGSGTLTFGATYTNSTDSDQLFVVTIPARLAKDSGNNHGLVRTNTASLSSTTDSGGGTSLVRQASSALSVVTPSPTLAKTASPTSVVGGQRVTYTLTAGNSAGRPPLHDSWVVDCLPEKLSFAAFTSVPDGTQATTVPGDGTNGCSTGSTRIAWKAGSIAGGSSIVLKYTATMEANPVGSQTYPNSATLTGGTLNDGKSGPLDPDNPLEQVLSVTATATVTVTGATVSKQADPTVLTIGERGSWTVSANLPAKVNFYDAAIIDALPIGMNLSSLTTDSITCVYADGSACSIDKNSLVAVNSGRTIGWGIGDLARAEQSRTVLITYSGRIADIAGNVAGISRTNTVNIKWNSTDGQNPTSAGATFDKTSRSATAKVSVAEPALTLAKSVDDATVEPGQEFTFSVRVANDGRASNVSPAHNITVTDNVPIGVVVTPGTISGGGTLAGGGPEGGGTITWSISGPLASDESASLTYRAKLAPSSTLDSSPLTNIASVAGYDSLPTDGRHYAGPTTSLTITPTFPHISPTKAAAAGPAYLGEPKAWTITLTNDGGGTAYQISATDTLPNNWTYISGSARVVSADGPAIALEPEISGQTLTWPDLDSLIPGAQIKIAFEATPDDPAAAQDPGLGTTAYHRNSVATVAEDATGETANKAGSYFDGPAEAATQIHLADVRITKTSQQAIAGSPLVYTLVVKNSGPQTAVGPFEVVDTLPPGLGAVSWSGSGWSCGLTEETVSCQRTKPADTLAAGASFPAITLRVLIPSGATGSLVNTASVSARTHDPDLSNNTSTVTNQVSRLSDLGITKRASGEIVAGSKGTYVLEVTNHGASDSAGPITITDPLPAGLTLVSASGSGWTCTGSTSISCTRVDGLLAGAAAPQVVVIAKVDPAKTGKITNTAWVAGPETDPQPANNTATSTDQVKTSADLQLSKSHVGKFVAGSTGVYEFVVDNFGPSVAAGPIRITDDLPDGISFQSDDSLAWSCSARAQNLTCSHAGPMAVGDQLKFKISVAIDPDHSDGLVNSAQVASTTADPHQPNNLANDDTAIEVESDLSVSKSHVGEMVSGAKATFNLTVSNKGPSDSPSGKITVTDTLPTGMKFVESSSDAWSCSEEDGLVTCTSESGLAKGESQSISITVALEADLGPVTLINEASVRGPAPDPDTSNNTSHDEVGAVDQSNVRIAKSASAASVVAGKEFSYLIEVTNDGPSDADNVRVLDQLPAGLTFLGVDPDPAVTCEDGPGIECYLPTLPAGTSQQVRVSARVGAEVVAGETITNQARLTTSTPTDDPSDNTSEAGITVANSADLGITKSHAPGTVWAGDEVSFTFKVHNSGPSDSAPGAVVRDTLPDGLTFVSGTTGSWSCSAEGQEVTCTLADNVPAGTDAPELIVTAQLDLSITEDYLDEGRITNRATVSGVDDDNPDNDSDTDVLTIGFPADLAITKRHLGTLRVGRPASYALMVTNLGPLADPGPIIVTDDLPAGLSFVSGAGVGWVCQNIGRKVTCTHEEGLAVGESSGLELRVNVTRAAYPRVANTASVVGGTGDPDLSNNTARNSSQVSDGSGGSDGSDDGLANTGPTSLWLALAGLVTTLAGLLLFRLGRRADA